MIAPLPSPYAVQCDVCQAQPGERCTMPRQVKREGVWVDQPREQSWPHYTRELKARHKYAEHIASLQQRFDF